MNNTERQSVVNDLKSSRIDTRLLYITPEQAATEGFKVSYFPAYKAHFSPPEKCDHNLTCVLCADRKYS